MTHLVTISIYLRLHQQQNHFKIDPIFFKFASSQGHFCAGTAGFSGFEYCRKKVENDQKSKVLYVFPDSSKLSLGQIYITAIDGIATVNVFVDS